VFILRTLRKNKQTIYYANQTGLVPIYEKDENGDIKYIEIDGVKTPVETGNYEMSYGKAVDVSGNITMSGDESSETEYGIDSSGYDAVLILDKGEADISETSVVWFENNVRYKDTENQSADPNSADYKVLKKVPSLNGLKYILGKRV